jgi:hypothetical protein
MKILPKIIRLIVIVFLVTLIYAGAGVAYAGSALEPEERIKILDAPELETWIDYAADGFEGGTGSEDDPFLIATAEQLAYFSKTVRTGNSHEGKYIKLIKDIDLIGRGWEPIGSVYAYEYDKIWNARAPFSGNFDGLGHVISNMTITNYFNDSGLFGGLTGKAAIIRNLKLENAIVLGGIQSGGIAGFLFYGPEVENCYVSGTIKGYQSAGGIVGGTRFASIRNCEVSVDVIRNKESDFSSTSFPYPIVSNSGGGIVGEFVRIEIINCHAKVNVEEFYNSNGVIGSVFGGDGEIKDSTAYGQINGKFFVFP